MAYNRAHQLNIDNACDCCPSHSSAEPVDLRPSPSWRREYRRISGRVEGTHSYVRADTGRMESVLTRMVDPILLLASYRRFARRAGYGAMHYGELLQSVVSPVHLPDMRPGRAMGADA